MMKYEHPELYIQKFDISDMVTTSDNIHGLVNGLQNGEYSTVIEVNYGDIVEFQ